MSSLIQFKSFVVSSQGNNTILSTRSVKGKLMVYSVLYTPNADITGEVQVKVGSEVKSGARNPKTGALYGFNHNPNFFLGGVGEAVGVTLPSATPVTVDVAWREAPDYSSDE